MRRGRALFPPSAGWRSKQGAGKATIIIHPNWGRSDRRKHLREGRPGLCQVPLPGKIPGRDPDKDTPGYANSFYPGASLADATTLRYESQDYCGADLITTSCEAGVRRRVIAGVISVSVVSGA